MHKLRTTLCQRSILITLCLIFITAARAENTLSSSPTNCVQIPAFYNSISSESAEQRLALLDSLNDPVDACEDLKLGLLLSHPAVGFQNDAKALDSLNSALAMLHDDAVDKASLAMVIDHVEERQVLRNILGSAQKKLRSLHKQLKSSQTHIDKLEGQIDQLKNLEAQLEDKSRETIEPEAVLDPADSADSGKTEGELIPEQSTNESDDKTNDPKESTDQ